MAGLIKQELKAWAKEMIYNFCHETDIQQWRSYNRRGFQYSGSWEHVVKVVFPVSGYGNEIKQSIIMDIQKGGFMNLSDYEFSKDGLLYGEDLVAPFKPILVKIKIEMNVETKSQEKTYIVSIELTDGRNLESKGLKSFRKISFFDKWRECVDAPLSNKQRNLLETYLQLQAVEAKTEKCFFFPRMGFYNEGYVFGKGQVKMRLDTDEYKQPDDIPAFPKLKINREEIVAYVGKFLSAKKGISEILILISILAILKPFLIEIGIPVNFVLELFGNSGLGKTLWSELACVQVDSQKLSFKTSSKIAIVRALDAFSGHTVLIDDFHPEATRNGRDSQNSKLDLIVRKAEDKKSAVSVITAEYLDGCFSVQDRMLQIEITDKEADEKKLNYLIEHKKYMSAFLYDFATYVYENKKDFLPFLTLEEDIMDAKKSEFRIDMTMAVMKICLTVLYKFYFGNDQMALRESMGIEEPETYIRENLDKLKQNQKRRMQFLWEKEKGVDLVEIVYRMLFEEKIFRECPDFKYINDERSYGLGIFEEEDAYYIPRSTLQRGLKKYLPYQVSVDKVAQKLNNAGILNTDKSKTYMKKKQGIYCYVISKYQLKVYHDLNGSY